MGHWLGYPTRETSSPCRLRGFSEGLLLLLLLHYFLCFSFSFLFLLLVPSSFSSSPTLDFFILSPAFLFLSFSLSFFHMYLFPFLLSPTFFPHESAARMMWCLPRMPGLAPGRPRGGPGASSCALGAPELSRAGAGVVPESREWCGRGFGSVPGVCWSPSVETSGLRVASGVKNLGGGGGGKLGEKL